MSKANIKKVSPVILCEKIMISLMKSSDSYFYKTKLLDIHTYRYNYGYDEVKEISYYFFAEPEEFRKKLKHPEKWKFYSGQILNMFDKKVNTPAKKYLRILNFPKYLGSPDNIFGSDFVNRMSVILDRKVVNKQVVALFTMLGATKVWRIGTKIIIYKKLDKKQLEEYIRKKEGKIDFLISTQKFKNFLKLSVDEFYKDH